MALNKKVSSAVKVTAIGSLLAASVGISTAIGKTATVSETPKEQDHTKKVSNSNQEKSNIVYIVLDDAGFSDLGSYGSEIKTPNIDKLAENGLRYNNFTVNPVCSPTRASLLTGRNHHSVGMGNVANVELGPDSPFQGRIKDEAATSAEILKENGYSTFAVTKWHAAPMHELTPAGPFDNWPLGKGFERFYGILESHTDQYAPELVYDNHMIEPPKDEDYHVSKDFVDQANQFVTDHASITPEKPFHLYLGFGATHAPIQVPEEYIDMYDGVYNKGWDEIRKERFERQKEMGIIPEDTELPASDPRVKAWDSLTKEEQELNARFQEAYAGFMTYTDEQIGRFVSHLEEVGELDNTLIFLISDNGASMESPNGSTSFVNYLNNYTVETKDLLEVKDKIGGPDVRAAYPLGWAQVSNTPYKNFKATLHNGGIKAPLIIHWPEGIQEEDKGEIRTQFHHVIDITPTALDIIGIEAPKTYDGVEQMPMHGTSMKYSFSDQDAPSERETQYYTVFGHRAIIDGGWKAVTFHVPGKPYKEDRWELYNLNEDYTESNNLAGQHPEKLEELQKLWQSEAEKNGALPFELTFPEYLQKNYVNPNAVNNRNHFTYYQGMDHLGTYATPKIQNRSYTITAEINRKNNKTEGVLVAHGDHMSGYTLYIKNSRVYYEYNHLGTVYQIATKMKVTKGDSTIRFEYEKIEGTKGKGTLYINDQKAGEVDMPKTFGGTVAEEGLDVGRDLLKPVSPNYGKSDNFKYNGEIYKVEYDLKDDILAK